MKPRQFGGFNHLIEALVYASHFDAQHHAWYDGKGALTCSQSYADIHRKTLRFASKLRSILAASRAQDSVAPKVAFIAQSDENHLPLFCACQCIKAVPCPLPTPSFLQDLGAYAHVLKKMCHSAGAATLIAPAHLFSPLQPFFADTHIDMVSIQALENHTAPNVDIDVAGIASHDVAYVQFSSGSTSDPKGVAVSHAALMRNVDALLNEAMRVTAQDRACSWLPFFHDMGLIGFVLAPLCAQIQVDYLPPSAFARRPVSWLNVMAQQQSTITYAPPFAWKMAAQHAANFLPGHSLQALRVAGVGGDFVHAEVLDAFTSQFEPHGFSANAFKVSYGMAEATLAVTISNAPRTDTQALHALHAPTAALNKTFCSAGQAIAGWAIEIRDASGARLQPRAIGEIFIQGPSLFSGYMQGGQLIEQPQGDFFATGDLGYLDEEAHLYVVGRSKDILIVNGVNIHPADIEQHLASTFHIPADDIHFFKHAATERCHVLLRDKHASNSSARGGPQVASAAAALVGESVEAHFIPAGIIVSTSSGKRARSLTQDNFFKHLSSAQRTAHMT